MSNRGNKHRQKPNLLIYYACQSPLNATQFGDCFFCGLPLRVHEHDREDRNYTMEWINPLTKEVKVLQLPFRVEGHHIRFACLRERETGYPEDFENVVWVHPKCHRKFHADISRRVQACFMGSRWSSRIFEEMMKPIDYGCLYLAPNSY